MRRDLQLLERWIQAHPFLAYAWTAGITVLILYVVILMDWAVRK